MQFSIGFSIGLIVGAIVGTVVTGVVLVAAAQSDRLEAELEEYRSRG